MARCPWSHEKLNSLSSLENKKQSSYLECRPTVCSCGMSRSGRVLAREHILIYYSAGRKQNQIREVGHTAGTAGEPFGRVNKAMERNKTGQSEENLQICYRSQSPLLLDLNSSLACFLPQTTLNEETFVFSTQTHTHAHTPQFIVSQTTKGCQCSLKPSENSE